MSQENVEVVRRCVAAFPHDMEEMLSYIDPESELHSAWGCHALLVLKTARRFGRLPHQQAEC